LPICQICGRSYTVIRENQRLGREQKTCLHPECIRELKRRNGLTWTEFRKSQRKMTNCLGEGCHDKFLSPVDSMGRSVEHFCQRCKNRKQENEDSLRFAEAWG